jgi:hypothetical protein
MPQEAQLILARCRNLSDYGDFEGGWSSFPRGLKKLHFIKIQKLLKTFDSREPYRTLEVQSSGES